MLVLLPSYPRSGSTLTRIILHNVFGITNFSQSNDKIFSEGPLQKVVGQENHVADNFSQALEMMNRRADLVTCKTHNLPDQHLVNYPAVYVVRDVRDVIVSLRYWFDPSKNITNQEELWEQAVRGGIWNSWSDHVEQWLQSKNLIAVLRFEDLIATPFDAVKNAFGDMLPLSDNKELPSFEELHRQRENFFRKGKVEEWKKELPPKLLSLVQELHGPTMLKLGYT